MRKELRPWLIKGDKPALKDTASHIVPLWYNGMASLRDVIESVAKPEPMGREKINEYLQRLQNLNQPSPQPSKRKQKKRNQLEL